MRICIIINILYLVIDTWVRSPYSMSIYIFTFAVAIVWAQSYVLDGLYSGLIRKRNPFRVNACMHPFIQGA